MTKIALAMNASCEVWSYHRKLISLIKDIREFSRAAHIFDEQKAKSVGWLYMTTVIK